MKKGWDESDSGRIQEESRKTRKAKAVSWELSPEEKQWSDIMDRRLSHDVRELYKDRKECIQCSILTSRLSIVDDPPIPGVEIRPRDKKNEGQRNVTVQTEGVTQEKFDKDMGPMPVGRDRAANPTFAYQQRKDPELCNVVTILENPEHHNPLPKMMRNMELYDDCLYINVCTSKQLQGNQGDGSYHVT